MATPDLARVIERLKAAKPYALVAHFPDGSSKDIAIPDVRRRWVRLRAIVENLDDWQSLDGVDKKGAVLVIVKNDRANEPDDDEWVEDISTPGPAGELGPLLNMMLRAQDVALNRNHQLVRTVMQSQTDLVKLVSERLLLQEKQNAANLQRLQEYAEALAEAQTGDNEDGEVTALLQALPALLKAGGDGTPPNGKS